MKDKKKMLSSEDFPEMKKREFPEMPKREFPEMETYEPPKFPEAYERFKQRFGKDKRGSVKLKKR